MIRTPRAARSPMPDSSRRCTTTRRTTRATWDAVVAEHRSVVDEVGAFGVPTIRLDDGFGPAIFGPVISRVPGDDEAVELWRHVLWLTRSDNFWELKRQRGADPDLEGVRVRKAEREARARCRSGMSQRNPRTQGAAKPRSRRRSGTSHQSATPT